MNIFQNIYNNKIYNIISNNEIYNKIKNLLSESLAIVIAYYLMNRHLFQFKKFIILIFTIALIIIIIENFAPKLLAPTKQGFGIGTGLGFIESPLSFEKSKTYKTKIEKSKMSDPLDVKGTIEELELETKGLETRGLRTKGIGSKGIGSKGIGTKGISSRSGALNAELELEEIGIGETGIGNMTIGETSVRDIGIKELDISPKSIGVKGLEAKQFSPEEVRIKQIDIEKEQKSFDFHGRFDKVQKNEGEVEEEGEKKKK